MPPNPIIGVRGASVGPVPLLVPERSTSTLFPPNIRARRSQSLTCYPPVRADGCRETVWEASKPAVNPKSNTEMMRAKSRTRNQVVAERLVWVLSITNTRRCGKAMAQATIARLTAQIAAITKANAVRRALVSVDERCGLLSVAVVMVLRAC